MVGYLAHADGRHSLTTEFIAMQYAQVSFTIVSRYLLLTTHIKSDPEHGLHPSYCTLDIFHAPVTPQERIKSGIGYFSSDGHHFSCHHSTVEAYHM